MERNLRIQAIQNHLNVNINPQKDGTKNHYLNTSTLASALPASTVDFKVNDKCLLVFDSLQIAYKEYLKAEITQGQSATVQRILCLHGWLDNAASFETLVDSLMPLLGNLSSVHIVAMDFLGHGKSDHLKGPHQYLDHLETINEFMDKLGWEKAAFIGHSYGGHFASVYAAACPHRVTHLIMIESWGPMTIETETTAKKLGLALTERTQLRTAGKNLIKAPKTPIFNSIEEAAIKFHRSFPKEYPFLLSSATILVSRSLKEIRDQSGVTKYAWSYDPKAKLRDLIPPSDQQVFDLFKAIRCPVLFLEGSKGFREWKYGCTAFKRDELATRERHIERLEKVSIKDAGHYVHMDYPQESAQIIARFLQ